MAEPVGRTLVVSDLHLRGPEDPNQQRFFSFLEARVAPDPDTTLVIAGDAVDFWFAVDTAIPPPHRELVERLERLPRVYWLEGNHDLGLSRALGARRQGLRFVDGVLELRCGSLRISVRHGDDLDPRDLGHRALRTVLRSPLARGLGALLGSERTLRWGSRVTAARSEGRRGDRAPSARWLEAARRHASQWGSSDALCAVGHGHHLGWWPEGLICLGDWLSFDSYLELDPAQAGPRLRRFEPGSSDDPTLAVGPVGPVQLPQPGTRARTGAAGAP